MATGRHSRFDGVTLAVGGVTVASVLIFLAAGHPYQTWIQVLLVVGAVAAVLVVAHPRMDLVQLSAAGRRAQRTQRHVAWRQVMLTSAIFLILASSVVFMPEIAAQRAADELASRVLVREQDRLSADVHSIVGQTSVAQSSAAGQDLQQTYCMTAGGFVLFRQRDGTSVAWGDVPPVADAIHWKTGIVQTLRQPREEGTEPGVWLMLTSTTAEGDIILGVPASVSRVESARARLSAIIALAAGAIIVATSTWFLTTVALKPVVSTVEHLEQFASDAGHELRGPLASILVNVDVALGSSELPGEVRDRLQAVMRQAQRATSLSNSFIMLARLDEVRPSTTDHVTISDVADEMRTRFQSELRSRGMTIVASGEELVVVTNRDLLLVILDGLVSNALRYGPSGSIVRLDASLMRDGRTRFAVADSGPGLSPDEAAHVFDRFWRADISRNRDTGGVGLGLAIVAKAAEALGGSVTAESNVGQGAVFSLFLPRAAAP
ncbi:MAG: sensor histidine kinase [Candidatus Cryosericum sp.]